MSELLPCPFCGGSAVTKEPDNWVTCPNITCPAGHMLCRADKWNTRAHPEGHVLLPLEDVKLLLTFAPKDCPKGLDPTFYHTLSYEGDMAIQDRVDAIRAMLKEGGDNG